MATTTAPDDDRHSTETVKPKTPKRKEEPTMTTNGDPTPTPPDNAAAPEPTTNPTPAMAPTPPEPTTTPPARPASPDPFDPVSLRLGTDFTAGLGVKRVLSVIPVRKPSKSEWFRVRPGDEWRLTTAILEVERGTERASYLVSPGLRPDLSGEISPAMLLTCVNRGGDLFVWRIKLPSADGRSNNWTDSAIVIASAAETRWCRMTSDMQNGHYSHLEPLVELPEPKWPDMTLGAMLKIAFRGRLIETADHPVLQELRGGE